MISLLDDDLDVSDKDSPSDKDSGAAFLAVIVDSHNCTNSGKEMNTKEEEDENDDDVIEVSASSGIVLVDTSLLVIVVFSSGKLEGRSGLWR